MRSKSAVYIRFFVVFAVLGVSGVAATVFVLANQRVRLPFEDVYTVQAEFSAANGVIGGIGQPVNVVGVKVGQVVDVDLGDGVAVVKMEIRRDELPRVHTDATATLTPVTPLKDMQIELAPGRTTSPVLGNGGTIGTEGTGVPVPLSDLLSTLDSDTRDYLTGLIASVDRGTEGRSQDLRRMLLRLAPTTEQAGRISRAMAQRDTQLASFVHNLARVTRAATQDGQLQTVVDAGQRTLNAIAEQDRALRSTFQQLPPTLDAARGTLARLPAFAKELTPTVDALLPTVERLPDALTDVGTFSARGSDVLSKKLRPFTRDARPVVRDAGIAVPRLRRTAAPLTGVAKSLNYVLNMLAHVDGGADQGYLFWTAWFMHNLNSVGTSGDANGAVLRAAAMVGCNTIQDNNQVAAAVAQFGVCP